MNTICVVVITYNGEEDILNFLKTFRAYTPSEVSLVVVDNASSDTTVDIVRERYPEAVVLQNTINRGYAGGAKQGMEYAMIHTAEYVAVVNQDILFTEHWLEPLCGYLDTHEQCAAVQPRIMMYPDTDIINSYGNAQHYLGFGYTFGYKKISAECSGERLTVRARRVSKSSIYGRFGRESEYTGGPPAGTSIDREKEFPASSIYGRCEPEAIYACENGKELATCSGAATLFRAAALRDVGCIDADYFMYYEDSDFSWRLRMAGYSLALACDSTVYHRYEFSRSIQKFYYMERNRLALIFTNYSLKTLALIAPMMIVMEVGMVAYSILGTIFGKRNVLTLKEKLRSYLYFFRPATWRYLASKRGHVQRSRNRADREMARLFADTIEFQDVDNILLRSIANPIMRWYWSVIRRVV